MISPENSQCQKPNNHHRAEELPYFARAKLLHKEYDKEYKTDIKHHRSIGIIDFKPLNSRYYRKRWRNHTIRNQSRCPNNRKEIKMLALHPLHKGVEGEYPALTFVICPQGNRYILYGCLQGKRPDNTRECTLYILVQRHSCRLQTGINNRLHYIERRSTNISENDAHRYQKTNERELTCIKMLSGIISRHKFFYEILAANVE